MKKNLISIIIAFVLCFSANSFSQTCQWAERIDGTLGVFIHGMVANNNGDIYVTGCYTSDTTYFNNEIILTNSGSWDGFLAKYNSEGICQWAKKIAGSGDDRGQNVTVDVNGDVIVVGYFNSPVLECGNNNSLTNTGNYDGFLCKFSTDGFCNWAEKIAGTSIDFIYSVSADSTGCVYISGNFNSPTLNFNNGLSINNSGYMDAFFAKYDTFGICQFVRKIAGIGQDFSNVISVNNSGYIFVGGDFGSQTLNFNNGITLNRNDGSGYLAMYDSYGDCYWAVSLGGSSEGTVKSLAVDINTNIYCVGTFNSPVISFNNGTTLSNSGSYDVFFAKYNTSGLCQWATRIAGTLSDGVSSIASDVMGNTYILGTFKSDSLLFDNDIKLFNNELSDIYLAKYNSTGICQWVERIAGDDNDYSASITIDGINNIYSSGFYYSQILDFNNDFFLTKISSGLAGFITKYSQNNSNIPLNQGWNTISSNILSNAPNMEDIFAEMEELVIVKNADGQIYNPAQNINQIGDWNIAHGYMVYVTAPATLQITGTAVDPTQTEINLVSGWNLVSYLRNSPLAISTALESISSSIILVKNNLGQLYYPAYGLNTIGNMQQGQGYWLYMNAPAVLTYPGN